MRLAPEKLRVILIGMGLITPQQFDAVVVEAKRLREPVERILVTKNYLSEEQLMQLIAEALKVPLIKLREQKITTDILNILPEKLARDHQAVVFGQDKDVIKVALSNPEDLEVINFIQKKTGRKVEIYLAGDSDLRRALMLYRQGLYKDFAKIINENVAQLNASGENMALAVEKLPVVKTIDSLIEFAVAEEASDIHIEPQESEIIIRFRVDGQLRDIISLPRLALDALIARIKYLTNLKIDEHRKPQDGRFKMGVGGERFAFRVSIIPTYHGEKMVLRLLPEESKRYSLEDLGLKGKNLDIIKRAIERPHGMLLVTGPTGSGKTTTLYTVLNMLNTEDVNISTVEDPIEYSIERVNQIQVNPGVGISFANGLRSILRQDPDIIMIGEIRDTETAEIAIHSALTGHLVLSTLHTNDAAGTLPRLIDMGIQPFLISSTVNVAVGQRLVRRLCPLCMESYKVDLKSLSSRQAGIDLEAALNHMVKLQVIAKKDWSNLRFFRSKGCDRCGGSGYRGRVGIYEVLEINDKIRELIAERKDSSVIAEAAVAAGMQTMLEDGIQKAFEGQTSIDEILRVIR